MSIEGMIIGALGGALFFSLIFLLWLIICHLVWPGWSYLKRDTEEEALRRWLKEEMLSGGITAEQYFKILGEPESLEDRESEREERI